MKDVKHIAIMMDGNGRWAKMRGENRMVGHFYGEKKFEEMCAVVSDRGIEHFTVYAFSTENWKRPKEEVDAIMGLLGKYFEACIKMADEFSYKVDVLGRRDDLDERLVKLIEEVETKTMDNKGLNIHIAVNYGGRDEIVRAIERMYKAESDKECMSFDENKIHQYMDCGQIPDPDIAIRTGGEKRLSNFMLWELAYSELFFIDKFWPDFSSDDLDEIINDFLTRDRRYGSIK